MNRLNKTMLDVTKRPIKILQYGEGNFLRAFVDYMVDVANEKGLFNGDIAIVKPISYGSLEEFHKQDLLYTLSLRGKEQGETKSVNRIITSIGDAVEAIEEYERYAAYSQCESLRFIVSNTTEAGIVYDGTDSYEGNPPKTFPGKLTKLLYERYLYFKGDNSKGLIIIPCELIEDNGKALKKCVSNYSKLWNLDSNFSTWLNESCIFCSTLVDRIVTGFPKDEAKDIWMQLGYEDMLLDTGELFGLWVIESEKDISDEFPLNKAGLPVIFTDNQKPYRERKVRILNGAHTSFVLASFLAGNDYVLESMQDKDIKTFMTKTIFNEIIPTLSLPVGELNSFAESVIERFENPYIKHALLSISLNSVSKWKARCLPSFKKYYKEYNKLPTCLTFSLAALMSFYRTNEKEAECLIGYRNGIAYKILDDAKVLNFFAETYNLQVNEFVEQFLKMETFFGEDLTKYPGLTKLVEKYLEEIGQFGIRKVIQTIINE